MDLWFNPTISLPSSLNCYKGTVTGTCNVCQVPSAMPCLLLLTMSDLAHKKQGGIGHILALAVQKEQMV